eukprot:gene55390-31691_t
MEAAAAALGGAGGWDAVTYEDLLLLDEGNERRGVRPDEWRAKVKERQLRPGEHREVDPISQDPFRPWQ